MISMHPRRHVLRLGLAFALCAATATAAVAQGNTDEALSQGITLYENLDVERALVVLRRVISPSSPFEVSREQRVTAYKYLGAALAILGQPDSSIVYFRAALERDPFLDLDPDRFTQQEQTALAEARKRSFATGLRRLTESRWDPAREGITFAAVTTHQAALRLEIQPGDGGPAIALHDREGDGIREIAWNGILGTRLAAPGAYEVRAIGRSLITGRVDSTSLPFTLRHDFPTLEDTLPALRADELLPERRPPSAGRISLMKGAAVAAATLLIPRLTGHSHLRDGGNGMATIAATAATGAGVMALVITRRSPEIPANIAQNNLRRAERAAVNAAIARRNQERLALTKIVLLPGAGR
jgi:hypothetical protein